MRIIDFRLFLQKGTVFDFSLNTSEADIVALLGNPDEIEKYGKNGKYLHFENIRLYIYKNYFNGVTIFFYLENFSIKESLEGVVLCVNQDTLLIDMLNILNKFSIKWDISYKNSALDYCVIMTSSGISIYYNYENGKLIKMSRNF